jgi:hypothetical protein
MFYAIAPASNAQDSSFTDEQIRAATQAQESEEVLEHEKQEAPWHFMLTVKSAHRGFGHGGNKAVFTGYIDQIFSAPPSEIGVKSQLISFSFYCGNTLPDEPVNPCKPYLTASKLEIWGKFTLGSEGRTLPDSLIVISMDPQD